MKTQSAVLYQLRVTGEAVQIYQLCPLRQMADYQLRVTGEAVQRLSAQLRATHPEAPRKLIAGTRDMLIHFYESVDVEEVWKMVTADMPLWIWRIKPALPASC